MHRQLHLRVQYDAALAAAASSSSLSSATTIATATSVLVYIPPYLPVDLFVNIEDVLRTAHDVPNQHPGHDNDEASCHRQLPSNTSAFLAGPCDEETRSQKLREVKLQDSIVRAILRHLIINEEPNRGACDSFSPAISAAGCTGA
jgi:hypothetical protein